MPLHQQRAVSQFKTRHDAERKRAGRKALPKRIAAANIARQCPIQPSGDVTRHLLLTSGAKEVIVLGDHDASGYAPQDVTARRGKRTRRKGALISPARSRSSPWLVPGTTGR